MPSANIKKKVICSKNKLIAMVLDIEKYPLFVPWCLDGEIIKKEKKDFGLEIIANLTIGKGLFKETYQSLVIYNKEKNTINVTSIKGPLKNLQNIWIFSDDGEFCDVDFNINFEMKNKFINFIVEKSFKIGLNRITKCFEERAKII